MLSCGKVDSSEVVCLQTLKALKKTHTHSHRARLVESGVSETELYCKLGTLQKDSSSVNNFRFLIVINHTTAKLVPVLQHMG